MKHDRTAISVRTLRTALVLAPLLSSACGPSATSTAPDAATSAAALEMALCQQRTQSCPEAQREDLRRLCVDVHVAANRSLPAACASQRERAVRCELAQPAICQLEGSPACEAAACALNECVAADQRARGEEPNFRGCDAGRGDGG